MRYIKAHTSIPVPEVYFYNFNLSNTVVAQYVFIERLYGQQLCVIWGLLSLDDKTSVMTALAVVVQLSALMFDRIGCLTTGGKVGPLLIKDSDFAESRTIRPSASTLCIFPCR